MSGGRFPHALIIEGPVGSGRKTLATLIAAALFEKTAGISFGEGLHRKKALAGNHPDLTIISGAGGGRSFHVEAIRQLRLDAQIRPNEAECRVFVLLDAQNLTAQAQNALLKLTEEPPNNTFFILTCVSREALLPTIRSRAAVITLDVLSPKECAQGAKQILLAQGIVFSSAEEEKMAAAAALSGGSIGGTLIIFKDDKMGQDAGRLALFIDATAAGRAYEMLSLLAPMEKDRERFVRFMEALKAYAVAQMALSYQGGLPRLTSGAAIRLAELADSAVLAAGQNVGIAALSTRFCYGMV